MNRLPACRIIEPPRLDLRSSEAGRTETNVCGILARHRTSLGYPHRVDVPSGLDLPPVSCESRLGPTYELRPRPSTTCEPPTHRRRGSQSARAHRFGLRVADPRRVHVQVHPASSGRARDSHASLQRRTHHLAHLAAADPGTPETPRRLSISSQRRAEPNALLHLIHVVRQCTPSTPRPLCAGGCDRESSIQRKTSDNASANSTRCAARRSALRSRVWMVNPFR